MTQKSSLGKQTAKTYGLSNGLEVTNDVFQSEYNVAFEQAEIRMHTIKAILVATLVDPRHSRCSVRERLRWQSRRTQPRAWGLPLVPPWWWANMVGSGFYLSPSAVAPYGVLAILSCIVTGIGAICLGLSFARLARIAPATGGPYAYTRMAYGDFAGFLVGWVTGFPFGHRYRRSRSPSPARS